MGGRWCERPADKWFTGPQRWRFPERKPPLSATSPQDAHGAGSYTSPMALPDYSYLFDHACERKGGEKALKALLPKSKSKAQLKKLGSDRYPVSYTHLTLPTTPYV